MGFIHGLRRKGGGAAWDKADDAHGDGASGGEEDESGEKDGAAASAFGEEDDAFAQGDVAGHGEGEGWCGGGLGDVAEGVGVDFGVRAFFDEVGVAGILALAEEGAAEPPDGGIEPMEDADEVCEGGHPEVAALNVAEFVEEGHF